MVEEINIGGGEAHDADSSGRMEPRDVEDRICKQESLEVTSSLLSWLWCPLLVGYAEKAEAGISGVESQPGLRLCVRVPALFLRNKDWSPESLLSISQPPVTPGPSRESHALFWSLGGPACV